MRRGYSSTRQIITLAPPPEGPAVSNRRKIDLRDELHICPFCRAWTVEVPAFWEDTDEVQDLVGEHVRACIGVADVAFR